MKKKLSAAIALALALAFLIAFAACEGGEEENTGPVVDPTVTVTETPQTYTMQAEYIDLSGVVGSGLSNAAAGVAMITGNGTQEEKDKGWGEGYYVSQMHAANCRLDFVFTARAEAGVDKISVRLSSELGKLTFTPSSLAFFLNGTELQYSVITVTGADTATPDLTAAVFADYTIPVPSGTKFTEGENTFSILVRENSLRGGGNGSTAGPMVDSVSFTTKAVLTWTDHKDNIEKRDDPSSDL